MTRHIMPPFPPFQRYNAPGVRHCGEGLHHTAVIHADLTHLSRSAGRIFHRIATFQTEVSLMEPAFQHTLFHPALHVAGTDMGAELIDGVETFPLAENDDILTMALFCHCDKTGLSVRTQLRGRYQP